MTKQCSQDAIRDNGLSYSDTQTSHTHIHMYGTCRKTLKIVGRWLLDESKNKSLKLKKITEQLSSENISTLVGLIFLEV